MAYLPPGADGNLDLAGNRRDCSLISSTWQKVSLHWVSLVPRWILYFGNCFVANVAKWAWGGWVGLWESWRWRSFQGGQGKVPREDKVVSVEEQRQLESHNKDCLQLTVCYAIWAIDTLTPPPKRRKHTPFPGADPNYGTLCTGGPMYIWRSQRWRRARFQGQRLAPCEAILRLTAGGSHRRGNWIRLFPGKSQGRAFPFPSKGAFNSVW